MRPEGIKILWGTFIPRHPDGRHHVANWFRQVQPIAELELDELFQLTATTFFPIQLFFIDQMSPQAINILWGTLIPRPPDGRHVQSVAATGGLAGGDVIGNPFFSEFVFSLASL